MRCLTVEWDVGKNMLFASFTRARIFHELPAATADMIVLPGVLRCRTLRRTVQVRLRSNPLRLPGGISFSTVSRRQSVKHPG
ncbi:MAG: hypothetical protein JRD00_00150 [Deltaproteobacteria bacterium]|nr:hypothetical protein [Deltaproteobacteria bacterium]